MSCMDLNHLLKQQQIALIEAEHCDEAAMREQSALRAESYSFAVRRLRETLGTHQY